MFQSSLSSPISVAQGTTGSRLGLHDVLVPSINVHYKYVSKTSALCASLFSVHSCLLMGA